MYIVEILPSASEDVRESAFWYESRLKGLGKRFTAEIRTKIHSLRINPHLAGIRYANVRTAVLITFPYMIHYITDEGSKTIVIVAVLHTSRNPDFRKEK